jgi:hypothetical protein
VEKGDQLMHNHWFWWALTMACVIWYSTITVYVAIKGASDIKNMLARLDAEKKREAEES